MTLTLTLGLALASGCYRDEIFKLFTVHRQLATCFKSDLSTIVPGITHSYVSCIYNILHSYCNNKPYIRKTRLCPDFGTTLGYLSYIFDM